MPLLQRLRHRLDHASIRDKILLIGLMPPLVALPLVGAMLIVWSNLAFDRLLITKVRSDLAVAHGYFERVLSEVRVSNDGVAGSHALQRAISAARPGPLQALLRGSRERLRVDFLNLHDAQGRLWIADWGAPAAGAAPALIGLDDAQRVLLTTAADSRSSVELVDADTLARSAPGLAGAQQVPLIATLNAAATDRTVEDRAMLLLATSPVLDDNGRAIGYLQGGVMLNRNLPFIDHINEIVYPEGSLPFGSRGTATLFLRDVRITTNVRLFQTRRAIGTRVSQQVREAVLSRGDTWLDRAFVVSDWYVSAYQPLTDQAGQRIGMLYVGFLEQPFTTIKYAMLASIAAVLLALTLIAAWLSVRWARRLAAPMERMADTMQRVAAGDAAARVGPTGSRDEAGQLAGHFDRLLDNLADKTAGLQRWADELDRRVAERTRALQASNQSLQAAQQQLVRSEKLVAIGRLTASVAHEINNPLAVIQGNLDLVRELLGKQGMAVDDELRLLDEQVNRMRLIVSQLLQYARPTEFAGYVEQVDVDRAIDDCLLLVGPELTRRAISVQRARQASHAAGINRLELQQVLVNLIVNAMQAIGDHGSLALSTRDWVDQGNAGGTAADPVAGVAITVADSGPGLDPQLLDRLFQPFVTTRNDGTGLGLWISQSLVERYGGRIEAGNRPQGGAAFTVYLRSEPLPQAAPADPLTVMAPRIR